MRNIGRTTAILFITGLVAGWAYPVLASEGKPAQVLITNVHVWDGTSDGVTKRINVLVEGNKVAKLRASESDAHETATILDGDGRVPHAP